jgi:hypothetical protein
MVEGFMNIPAPIILPMITEVAGQKPIRGTSEEEEFAGILGR